MLPSLPCHKTNKQKYKRQPEPEHFIVSRKRIGDMNDQMYNVNPFESSGGTTLFLHESWVSHTCTNQPLFLSAEGKYIDIYRYAEG